MTDWALRLAWLAVALLAAMPVLGRWLDPAPVLDTGRRDTLSGGLSLMLDVLALAGHRAWMLPAVIALSALALLLSCAAFGWLNFQHAPWPQRRVTLWPLGGLVLGLLASVLLDEHLPEFYR
jgi:hypothetical protein